MQQHLLGRSGVFQVRTGRLTVDFQVWVWDKQASSQRMGVSLMKGSGVLGHIRG